jgi:hypothetical protein
MSMNLTHQSQKRGEKVIREVKDVHKYDLPPYLEEEEENELQHLLVSQTFNNITLSFSQISEII